MSKMKPIEIPIKLKVVGCGCDHAPNTKNSSIENLTINCSINLEEITESVIERIREKQLFQL